MTELADGIYFELPFEEYLAIERLSKSSIKQISISPADWWRGSWFDPNPPVLTPDQQKRQQLARVLGRAYHTARLEPHLFEEQFARAPSQADFPDGLLSNATQIGEVLTALGETKKKSGENVEQQAERLVAAGFKGAIWAIVQRDFADQLGDRQPIGAVEYDDVVEDMRRLRQVPEANEALTGGAPEVSILYTCADTGLQMKARIDYLKPDCFVELKSFGNPSGKSLMQNLIDAIRYNRYHVDAAAYLEAIEVIRSGELEVRDGTSEQADMIAAIREQPIPLPFKIVWQQKGGVPNILVTSLSLFIPAMKSDVQGPSSPLLMKARHDIIKAKKLFSTYCEIYQPGEPWFPIQGEIQFVSEDFSSYWLESY